MVCACFVCFGYSARTLTGLGIGRLHRCTFVVANAEPVVGWRFGRLAAVETSGFVAGPVIGALLNDSGVKSAVSCLLFRFALPPS